jgi:hypothetical protein
MVLRRDQRDNLVERSFFGFDGAPILSGYWGFARVVILRDEHGNEIENAYFGVDGEPMLREGWGAARMTFRLDGRGNIVEEAYFGIDGKPILSTRFGAARRAWRYDDRGDLVERQFFDADGMPAENDRGFATVALKRDGLGRLLEACYFDRRGRPVLRANRLTTDDGLSNLFGSWNRFALSGPFEQAAIAKLGEGGFACIVHDFDARGDLTRRAFLGVDAEPVPGPNGVAEERVAYDAFGRAVLYQPMLDDASASSTGQIWTRLTYDIAGVIWRVDYVDPDDRIVNGKRGFATIVWFPRPDGSSQPIYKNADGQVVPVP